MIVGMPLKKNSLYLVVFLPSFLTTQTIVLVLQQMGPTCEVKMGLKLCATYIHCLSLFLCGEIKYVWRCGSSACLECTAATY